MRRLAASAFLLSLLAAALQTVRAEPPVPPPPAESPSLADGQAAFDRGDWAAAREALTPLARSGSAQAAWLLGRLAEQGWGEPPSDPRAWRFYRQAAEGGLTAGLLAAADFAAWGRGTPADPRLAESYYRRAAEAGDMRARGQSGLMTLEGRGRRADPVQGLDWLRQAAEADDPEALAAWDRLAAARRVAPLPAGSADPAEAPARQLLDSLRRAFAAGPLGGGPPTALSRADGSVLVTVPAVVLPWGKAAWQGGLWRFVFRDITAEGAALTLLPSVQMVLRQPDGRIGAGLSLRGARLVGRWSFARPGLLSLQATALAVTAEGERGAFSLHGLSLERGGEEEPLAAAGQGWRLTGRAELAAGPVLGFDARVDGWDSLLSMAAAPPSLLAALRAAGASGKLTDEGRGEAAGGILLHLRLQPLPAGEDAGTEARLTVNGQAVTGLVGIGQAITGRPPAGLPPGR